MDETPASRQVLKRYLAAKAGEFILTKPETKHLPRNHRRQIARDLARRVGKKSLEEIK